MARKNNVNYFDTFVELAEYSCKAAGLLSQIMNDYRVDSLQEKMKQMQEIEHDADKARHKMIKKLVKEFITPIEREDIMSMADAIDNVTDTIEDVLMRMYMFNIKSVRKHALKMTDVIVKCCDTIKLALQELHNFRKSRKLNDLIIEINFLEEQGDKLYMEAVRDLFVNCENCSEVVAWDQTFHYFERCCDACEYVANLIEFVVMKNS